MRVLFVSLAAVLLVVTAAWLLASATTPVTQPIAYNHNLHVEQEGLACLDCHSKAEEMASATIPRRVDCEDCHDSEPLSESAEESVLIEYIETEREIPWNRVYEVPTHVYFSHRRHVSLAEIQCAECHGAVSELTAPPATPFVELSMDWCMDCHRERKVTNDCLACHR